MEERQVTNNLLVNGKLIVSQKGEEFAQVLVDDVVKSVKRLMADRGANVHLTQVIDEECGSQVIVLYATK